MVKTAHFKLKERSTNDGTDHSDDSDGDGHGRGNLGCVRGRESSGSAPVRAIQSSATDGYLPGFDDHDVFRRHDRRRSGVGSLDMELPQAVLTGPASSPFPQQAHDLTGTALFLLNEFLNSCRIQLCLLRKLKFSCRQRKTNQIAVSLIINLFFFYEFS